VSVVRVVLTELSAAESLSERATRQLTSTQTASQHRHRHRRRRRVDCVRHYCRRSCNIPHKHHTSRHAAQPAGCDSYIRQ